jgi:hypothetical protein
MSEERVAGGGGRFFPNLPSDSEFFSTGSSQRERRKEREIEICMKMYAVMS